MPAEERRSWDFKSTQDMQVQFREPHALEYIAYYLDKIEQHLARSAESNAKIQVSLTLIAQVLPRLVSGVNQ